MEPTGFHLYSSHIARDTSLSIYRRFAVLNTRNILYLQSELADLEAQLQRLDAKGNGEEVDNDTWAISRSWRKMRDAGVSFQESKPAVENIQQSQDAREMRDAGLSIQESNTTVKSIQATQDPRNSWSVMLKIRRLLKEYSKLPQLGSSLSSTHFMLDKALQAQAWLQSLERPPKHVPETMRKVLQWDVDLRSSISEIDVEYLDLKNSRDVISLTPGPNREAFSRFLINKLSWVLLPTEARQEAARDRFHCFIRQPCPQDNESCRCCVGVYPASFVHCHSLLCTLIGHPYRVNNRLLNVVLWRCCACERRQECGGYGGNGCICCCFGCVCEW